MYSYSLRVNTRALYGPLAVVSVGGGHGKIADEKLLAQVPTYLPVSTRGGPPETPCHGPSD